MTLLLGSRPVRPAEAHAFCQQHKHEVRRNRSFVPSFSVVKTNTVRLASRPSIAEGHLPECLLNPSGGEGLQVRVQAPPTVRATRGPAPPDVRGTGQRLTVRPLFSQSCQSRARDAAAESRARLPTGARSLFPALHAQAARTADAWPAVPAAAPPGCEPARGPTAWPSSIICTAGVQRAPECTPGRPGTMTGKAEAGCELRGRPGRCRVLSRAAPLCTRVTPTNPSRRGRMSRDERRGLERKTACLENHCPHGERRRTAFPLPARKEGGPGESGCLVARPYREPH